MRYQLVIFDWDGTLVDSHDHIIDSILGASAELDLELPSRLAVSKIIGLSMKEAILRLYPSLKEGEIIEYRQAYGEAFNHSARLAPQFFRGVKSTLDYCKQSEVLMAVATGKRRAGLLQGLDQTCSAEYFEILRTADDCASKPQPDMVLEILDALKIRPERALVIGDSVLDVEMAAAAKVDAIGVTTGSASVEDFEQTAAFDCIDTIEELISKIN